MNRLLNPRRERDATQPLDDVTTDAGTGSPGGGLRKALLGLGFAGLAYLAARRVRRSESTPSMDEVRETVGGVRSGEGFEIPIGETGEETGDQDESSEGTGTTEGAIGNEPMPGEDLSSGSSADQEGTDQDASGQDASNPEDAEQDLPDQEDAEQDLSEQERSAETDSDQELSDEAIEERTEEDAHEEPKEPGEMTVDEDAADDVLGEETEETEGGGAEETKGGEADETERAETAADGDEDTDSDETDDEESA